MNLILLTSKTSRFLNMGFCVGLLGLFSFNVQAAEFYAGGAVGHTRVSKSDFDDKDIAIKGFGGIKLKDYFGIEAALSDFGSSESSGYSSELTALTVAAVGYMSLSDFLPVADKYEAFVKGGKFHWNNDVKYFNTYSDDISGNDRFYGTGMNIHFNERVALRLEIERYKLDLDEDANGGNLDQKYNLDVASIGAFFKF
ncbi:MAG: porin family protein [Gammaproteobacteria bacterium]|nr:porin family protein [Gammaproteobacteria bacterium]